MKPSLVKPHCIEHVGDLYFQCPVQLNHICLWDQEQTTLKGEKGTGEDGIGPSLLTGHPQWCWLCTVLTACVLTEYGTGCVQYWVPEIMAARGTECMWIKCVQKACGLLNTSAHSFGYFHWWWSCSLPREIWYLKISNTHPELGVMKSCLFKFMQLPKHHTMIQKDNFTWNCATPLVTPKAILKVSWSMASGCLS